MRNNQPVTQKEYELQDGCAIISHTDDKGHLTHFNREFQEASGFESEELLGKPHNLVRHPDMPEEAFRDLWATLKRGRPWSGLVKNRRKNGDHYWVQATATPCEGGFKSIRIKPSRAQVAAAEALYAKMRGGAKVRLHEGRVFPDNLTTRIKLALENVTLQQRFWLWAAFSTVVFYVAVAIGWTSLHADKQSLRSLHDDRIVPLVQLNDIRGKLNTQRLDVLLAYQHDPEGKLAAVHDHSVATHLEEIARLDQEIDQLWAAFLATNLTEDEKKLASDFADKRKAFAIKLGNAVEPVRAGNYDARLMSSYVAAGQQEFKEMVAALYALAKYQETVATQEYQTMDQRYAADRNLFIVLLVLGAVVGTLMGVSALGRLKAGMKLAGETARSIASGDLTRVVPVSGEDEVGQLLAQLAIMRNNLHELVAEVRGEVSRLDIHSQELSKAARDGAGVAEAQSESTASMAAAVEELSVSIDQVEENAIDARQVTLDSAGRALESSRVIEDAAAEMQKIADVVVEAASGIRDLEAISNEITSIVEVIRDVADQTNLLALNAAIEAARAGEQGRGFAVVADEVRKLAERTSASSGEITQMISRIQEAAHQAVNAMEKGVSRVESGVSLSRGAGNSVREIRDAQSRVTQVVDDISLSLKEQVEATRSIAIRVERVSQATEGLAATVRKTQTGAEELRRLAEGLDKLTSRFRVA